MVASAQRCLNLISEPIPQDSGEPAPVALYPTPGLRALQTFPEAPIRGVYMAANGVLYVAAGAGLYAVAAGWSYARLGGITPGLETPVSMSDNGLSLVVVDGAGGWQLTFATNAWAPLAPADPQAYRYWRIQVSSSAMGGNIAMAEVQLWSGGVRQTLVGANASASDTFGGYAASYAADGVGGTCWASATGAAWWMYDFGSAAFVRIDTVAITARSDMDWTQGPQNFTVECSNDNSTWLTAGTFGPVAWTQGQQQTFGVVPPVTLCPFVSADRVDYLDTYFIFNKPGTPQFISSLSLSTSFDPLYFANKQIHSDNLASLIVSKREIWLIGETSTEVWYDTGAADFPFGAMPGVFIDRGAVAKYSVAEMDNAVYWLAADRYGAGIVIQGSGYAAKRISTFAIEAEFTTYPTLADAVGYTYQLGGHLFYVLSFPAADKTWCFDASCGMWHELAWIDTNGTEHRHRAGCATAAYGVIVAGDWQTGSLYALDAAVFTDNGQPVKRQRAFPHLLAEGRRVFYRQFLADMEAGNAPAEGGAAAPALPGVSIGPGVLSGGITVPTASIGAGVLSGTFVDTPTASLSASSLTFASTAVGATTAAQTITITNTGTANLVISAVSVSGDFVETGP